MGCDQHKSHIRIMPRTADKGTINIKYAGPDFTNSTAISLQYHRSFLCSAIELKCLSPSPPSIPETPCSALSYRAIHASRGKNLYCILVFPTNSSLAWP